MRILGDVKTNTFPHVVPAPVLDSPQSFAKFLSVSGQAVRNWVREGTIPCVINTGRIIRFERTAAIEALKGGKVAP